MEYKEFYNPGISEMLCLLRGGVCVHTLGYIWTSTSFLLEPQILDPQTTFTTPSLRSFFFLNQNHDKGTEFKRLEQREKMHHWLHLSSLFRSASTLKNSNHISKRHLVEWVPFKNIFSSSLMSSDHLSAAEHARWAGERGGCWRICIKVPVLHKGQRK